MEEKKGPEYYAQFDIKKYRHWTLRVRVHPMYLGQAILWLEREGDMQRLSSLTEEERKELWEQVLPKYEAALEKLFKPDHMNYAWLGNLFHEHKGHGHLHLIPRYASPREFEGFVFTDDNWGRHYKIGDNKDVPVEVVFAMRDAFRQHIH